MNGAGEKRKINAIDTQHQLCSREHNEHDGQQRTPHNNNQKRNNCGTSDGSISDEEARKQGPCR